MFNINYLNMKLARLTLACWWPKIFSRIRDDARLWEIYPCGGAESPSEIKLGPAVAEDAKFTRVVQFQHSHSFFSAFSCEC
jgi:hypothetical protein